MEINSTLLYSLGTALRATLHSALPQVRQQMIRVRAYAE